MTEGLRLRHPPGDAIVRLVPSLIVGFVIVGIQPTIVPPGNVWSFSDTLASIVVLVGAWWSGRLYYKSLLFLFYGMLAGTFVGLVFLPDARDWIGISKGFSSLNSYILSYCGFVIVFGFVCCAVGKLANVLNNSCTSNPALCKTCGYNLTGNTSGICSECGERI